MTVKGVTNFHKCLQTKEMSEVRQGKRKILKSESDAANKGFGDSDTFLNKKKIRKIGPFWEGQKIKERFKTDLSYGFLKFLKRCHKVVVKVCISL